MYGHMAYALRVIARNAPHPTATTLPNGAIRGVCNTPMRRCNSLLVWYLRIYKAHSKSDLGKTKTPQRELWSYAVCTRLELVTPCVTGMYSNQLN